MSEAPKKPNRAATAKFWWRDLQDLTDQDAPNPKADRAARARLRRATPETALTDAAVHDLYRRLWGDGFSAEKMTLAIRLALVLVHVRADDREFRDGRPRRFGEAIGRQTRDEADAAVLQPLRFKRLLQARDEDEIIRQFRRAVALAGKTVNVYDLAHLLLYWNQEPIRTRLAFEYFGAGTAAPEPQSPSA